MKNYDENNFREVEWYEGISVICFFAAWCPPCLANKETFETFSEWLPEGVKVGSINVDISPVLTSRYRIYGLPIVLYIHKSKVIKYIAGVKSLIFYQEAFLETSANI